MSERPLISILAIICLAVHAFGCGDDTGGTDHTQQQGGDVGTVSDMTNDDAGGTTDVKTADVQTLPDQGEDASSNEDMTAADMSAGDMASSDMATTDMSAGDMTDAQADSGLSDTGASDMADMEFECPPPEDRGLVCIQVIAWAKDPVTGNCCQYPTPCTAPEGWETFNSESDCQAA